ncbi:MAG: SPFH domain-containing protein [Anaerolineaceae bacterium]|nr:SPFH domain-containing protein [Anaerolineaceae bacterium]MCY4008736.1 SPFH domain-containing protein [Anaerolineaceae bacterium]MCY4106895.1 SPFH domain-containing protein [Chloroflexota bacterium]
MEFEGLAGAATIIPILVIIILIFWLLVRIVRVVPQYERLVILALGKYSATRGPGLIIVIPILERATKVDLRERFLDIPAQTAITRDNAPISIDFLVYYRVIDPKLSVLEVDNVVSASLNIATTTLRAVIGDITLDDVLSKREQINDTLRVKLDEVTERWGLKITSVEIREIEPPRAVQEAMNRQMSAERERRAQVLRADGEREAAISVAEGEKQAAILRAEGAKESVLLEAAGEKEAQLLKAEGYARALSAIHRQARRLEANSMALQYLETLKEIGASESTKFVLPMELTAIAQQLSGTLQDRFSNGQKDAAE